MRICGGFITFYGGYWGNYQHSPDHDLTQHYIRQLTYQSCINYLSYEITVGYKMFIIEILENKLGKSLLFITPKCENPLSF